mgnify:CR=1 FL=1
MAKGEKLPRKKNKIQDEKIQNEIEEIKRKLLSLKFCPRPDCGEEISYIETRQVGDQIYFYAVHNHGYTKDNGKTRPLLKRCYLGAYKYDYVERFNNLGLSGYVNPTRFEEYLKSLIDTHELDIKEALRIVDMLVRKLSTKIKNEDNKIMIITELEDLIDMVKGK